MAPSRRRHLSAPTDYSRGGRMLIPTSHRSSAPPCTNSAEKTGAPRRRAGRRVSGRCTTCTTCTGHLGSWCKTSRCRVTITTSPKRGWCRWCIWCTAPRKPRRGPGLRRPRQICKLVHQVVQLVHCCAAHSRPAAQVAAITRPSRRGLESASPHVLAHVIACHISSVHSGNSSDAFRVIPLFRHGRTATGAHRK